MVAAVENRPFESSTGQIDADIGARECERDRDRDRADGRDREHSFLQEGGSSKA